MYQKTSFKVKVTKVKVVGQGHKGQCQRLHGSRSKAVGQGNRVKVKVVPIVLREVRHAGVLNKISYHGSPYVSLP